MRDTHFKIGPRVAFCNRSRTRGCVFGFGYYDSDDPIQMFGCMLQVVYQFDESGATPPFSGNITVVILVHAPLIEKAIFPKGYGDGFAI